MSLWSAGLREVTCLFGAENLPGDLVALLTRYGVRELELCLDGDRAGRQAVARLSQELSGRGFSCRIIALPDGFDPNRISALLDSRNAEMPSSSETSRPARPASRPSP